MDQMLQPQPKEIGVATHLNILNITPVLDSPPITIEVQALNDQLKEISETANRAIESRVRQLQSVALKVFGKIEKIEVGEDSLVPIPESGKASGMEQKNETVKGKVKFTSNIDGQQVSVELGQDHISPDVLQKIKSGSTGDIHFDSGQIANLVNDCDISVAYTKELSEFMHITRVPGEQVRSLVWIGSRWKGNQNETVKISKGNTSSPSDPEKIKVALGRSRYLPYSDAPGAVSMDSEEIEIRPAEDQPIIWEGRITYHREDERPNSINILMQFGLPEGWQYVGQNRNPKLEDPYLQKAGIALGGKTIPDIGRTGDVIKRVLPDKSKEKTWEEEIQDVKDTLVGRLSEESIAEVVDLIQRARSLREKVESVLKMRDDYELDIGGILKRRDGKRGYAFLTDRQLFEMILDISNQSALESYLSHEDDGRTLKDVLVADLNRSVNIARENGLINDDDTKGLIISRQK